MNVEPDLQSHYQGVALPFYLLPISRPDLVLSSTNFISSQTFSTSLVRCEDILLNISDRNPGFNEPEALAVICENPRLVA